MARRRNVALASAIVLTAFLGVAVIANGVLRPGCSLLPVPLPSDSDRSVPGTAEQACAILGRPLPEPRTLPEGASRSAIGIGGPVPGCSKCPRSVSVTYSKDGRGFALLILHAGGQLPTGNVSEIHGSVDAAPAVINRTNGNTEAGALSYLWWRDGILYTFHVDLGVVTTDEADAIAASIR